MPNVNRLPKKFQSNEKKKKPIILLRHSDGCDCIRKMHTNIKRNVMWKPLCDASHLCILFRIGDTLLPLFLPFLSHMHNDCLLPHTTCRNTASEPHFLLRFFLLLLLQLVCRRLRFSRTSGMHIYLLVAYVCVYATTVAWCRQLGLIS